MPRQKNTDLVQGSVLTCGTSTYQVLSFLGQGCFGKVLKCQRTDEDGLQKVVALKTMRKIDGEREVVLLEKVKKLDEACLFVKWERAFSSKRLYCLEFEFLHETLDKHLRESNSKCLHLQDIRQIIQQLTGGLCLLKAEGIIHTDLKLDNVMLVDHKKEPYRVKIIDFGLARQVSEAKQGETVQARGYRSPEVMLGLPYSEAIDMWAVGCIVARMFIGDRLFRGSNEYELLKVIMDTLGPIPQDMLTQGLKTDNFFRQGTDGLWNIKSQKCYYQETKSLPLKTKGLKLKSLDELKLLNMGESQDPADEAAETADREVFVDLLKRMLQLKASDRIQPLEVLQHPFITMDHLRSCSTTSTYAKSSIMKAGQSWLPKVVPQRSPPLARKRKRDEDEDVDGSPTFYHPSKKARTAGPPQGQSHISGHKTEGNSLRKTNEQPTRTAVVGATTDRRTELGQPTTKDKTTNLIFSGRLPSYTARPPIQQPAPFLIPGQSTYNPPAMAIFQPRARSFMRPLVNHPYAIPGFQRRSRRMKAQT